MPCFREPAQLQARVRASREEMSLFQIPALQKEPCSLVSQELQICCPHAHAPFPCSSEPMSLSGLEA